MRAKVESEAHRLLTWRDCDPATQSLRSDYKNAPSMSDFDWYGQALMSDSPTSHQAVLLLIDQQKIGKKEFFSADGHLFQALCDHQARRVVGDQEYVLPHVDIHNCERLIAAWKKSTCTEIKNAVEEAAASIQQHYWKLFQKCPNGKVMQSWSQIEGAELKQALQPVCQRKLKPPTFEVLRDDLLSSDLDAHRAALHSIVDKRFSREQFFDRDGEDNLIESLFEFQLENAQERATSFEPGQEEAQWELLKYDILQCEALLNACQSCQDAAVTKHVDALSPDVFIHYLDLLETGPHSGMQKSAAPVWALLDSRAEQLPEDREECAEVIQAVVLALFDKIGAPDLATASEAPEKVYFWKTTELLLHKLDSELPEKSDLLNEYIWLAASAPATLRLAPLMFCAHELRGMKLEDEGGELDPYARILEATLDMKDDEAKKIRTFVDKEVSDRKGI